MGSCIRFDWAMKRLLRDTSCWAILEGLLTVVLNKPVRILHVLQSCAYCEDDISESFRMDLLVDDSGDGPAWLEIQNNNEYSYYQRTLFGLSKELTTCINCGGDGYEHVRKVYSVNIVYFSLGHGKDFVYHGKTEFRGIHEGDLLELSPFQRQTFHVDEVSQLYPEYYILKVNDFNRVAQSLLEEWIYYLNTGEVPDNATAPGLDTVKKQLQLDRMSKEDLMAYYRHLDNIVILRDNIYTERAEGRAEGLKEGRAEGLKEGRAEGLKEANLENARRMKAKGYSIEDIMEITGLTMEDVSSLTDI